MTRDEAFELALAQRRDDHRAACRPTDARLFGDPITKGTPSPKALEADRLEAAFRRLREESRS